MAEQIQRCRLGFSCSLMMQQTGIDASQCTNRLTCGAVVRHEHDQAAARAEFVRVQQQIWGEERTSLWIEYLNYLEQERQSLQLSRTEAAIAMLLQRARPQSVEDFDITPLFEAITAHLQELQSIIESEYSRFHFIAPERVQAHHYNATGSRGRYTYNKLQASQPIFAPSVESRYVRMVHLSHDDDPRNIEARRGIERRERLELVKASLQDMTSSLSTLISRLQEPLVSIRRR